MSLCSELLVGVDDPNGLLKHGNSTCKFGHAFASVRSWNPDFYEHANKIR